MRAVWIWVARSEGIPRGSWRTVAVPDLAWRMLACGVVWVRRVGVGAAARQGTAVSRIAQARVARIK